jgi:hypothetical protein
MRIRHANGVFYNDGNNDVRNILYGDNAFYNDAWNCTDDVGSYCNVSHASQDDDRIVIRY